MGKKYFVDVVINKEKLSSGKPVFVAHSLGLGIASQGNTVDEAMKNIREAIDLYLEEQPSKYEELVSEEVPFFSILEVNKNAKVAGIVR
ncbi:MAG: type II toxin-antitoxin system HicB family antitoxin [Candidatus Nanoarchaeia archaeon]|nr:type II toxin-antitoxin system HicB family antitoxin [Candidatus Nanoarchaeia archaeon]